jgi:phospholipase C
MRMASNEAVGTIKHVFVLMLENRSFDHMLGFSGITGTDAVTAQPTQINGLSGTEANTCGGSSFPVTHPADFVMPVDPHHEFTDVLQQLCGKNATYPRGGPYPAVDNSGFADNYVGAGGSAAGEIMKCYEAHQLPVLAALAKEFAVCDQWYASMPGPTWPNRFFVHAASAGGLDHSPTAGEVALWESFSGFHFENGTIFNALDSINRQHGWRIYSGDDFPNVAALKGINNFEVKDLDDFAADVAAPDYPCLYTFIEPNYGDVVHSTFKGGNSQHPLDDVTHGEALIKSVYEAVRRSPIWASSLLIITWDEHGGFYDHIQPPPAVAPGDRTVTGGANRFAFAFDHYGPRVPAVVISPLIPKNIVDHRQYDHASVPATLEAIFGLKPLTKRDANANNLTSLASLAAPRTDAPTTLPNPAATSAIAARAVMVQAANDAAPVDAGNLPGFLHAALRSDLALSNPQDHDAILARFQAIKTRADAQNYLDAVRVKVRAGRAAIRHKSDRISRARQP